VLSLADDLEPGDRQLGELLQSLELVDADTLTALLLEARRQRRSLRQVLLGGRDGRPTPLTLYQLALIESGSLDGLALGRLRVVDRLQVTPRETVYRVFDPGRSVTGLLRHLADADAQDPARADEFRTSFVAATKVEHANVAQTLEVLDINGRPAVLQEWVTGLPASDWPAAVAVPGVWYRLLRQCALGLRAAHEAGLTFGRMTPSSLVLTGLGVVKLLGLGEPPWLCGIDPTPFPPPTRGEMFGWGVAGDLAALGELASGWAALAPRRRGGKSPKPLPPPLQAVLTGLQPGAANAFATAADLLAALDGAAGKLPDAADAWDTLIEQATEIGAEPTAWRKSA
jgi:hypothetical protein